ncbi:MAG: hypothetical protein QOJ69_1601 [Actinomycetota bacterium]|nr:hypothetical protein [Actinomycetota bacterium]
MNQGRTGGGRGPRVLVRSAASAAVLLVVGMGWASPAGAHPDADGHGTISLSASGDTGSPPTVSGTFFGASALGVPIENIRSVSLTATPTGPTGGGQVGADGCKVATAGKCGSGSVTFKWQIPSLAYNGPYVVNATADHCQVLCVTPGPATVTPREFRLAADPAAPADVRAEAGGDRNVVLSWGRNAEPDLLYYQVSRKQGGGNFARVGGDIRQPASGRPAFVDTSTSGTPGGEFSYRVVAVRKGPSGDDSTTRTSGASGEKSVTVPAPPAPAAPGAPGSEAKTAGSDTNIGGYLAGQAPALGSPKPIFHDLPDTGYEGSLPFGQLPGEDLSEPGDENASPASLETRRLQAFNRGRPLIPIAAGAILLLLAAHLRLFNKRLKGDEPDHGTSAARFIAMLDASKQTAMPLDVEAAVANGGHHREPSGAVLADLPEWGSFRGVTLLPAAPSEDEDGGDEAWAGDDAEDATPIAVEARDRDESAVDAAALDDAALDDAAIDDDGAFAELEHDEQDWVVAEPALVEDEAEDDFLVELEEDDHLAELEPAEDDEAYGELEAAEDDEAYGELEAAEGDGAVAEPAFVDDDELAFELEQDEEAEVVSLLVPASGPVVVSSVKPEPAVAEAVAMAIAEPAVAEPEVAAEPEDAAGTNGSSDPLSDFDDFEWSEEAQYAEPEVEVFVGPRLGGKKLASRAR